MNHLAELLMTSGRLSEAEILYRQIVESDSDSDAQSRLASYNSLANVCRQLGRREEAVEWYQRALDMAEMTGRPGDPAVLAAYNNLAGLYQKIGRSEEAVEWYQRAVRMAEMTGRPGDTTAMLAVYNNFAAVYRKMGRREEAIGVYKRALHIAERTGRPADSTVMAICNNLASVYKEIGRSAEAVRWYEQALDAARRIFGSESVQTASQLNNLADTLIEVGRVDEAETLLRQALDIHLTRRGKKSPVAGRTRGGLARLLEASGRSEEAAEVSEKAKFDVFISYGSRDLDLVQDLAEKLTERGLSVWFDQWQLRPGDSIRPALTEAVSSAASFVFCIGQSGPDDGMQDELSKSLARREQKNQLIIPLILANGDPAQIPLHLREYQFLDLRGGLTDQSLDPLLSSIRRRRRKA